MKSFLSLITLGLSFNAQASLIQTYRCEGTFTYEVKLDNATKTASLTVFDKETGKNVSETVMGPTLAILYQSLKMDHQLAEKCTGTRTALVMDSPDTDFPIQAEMAYFISCQDREPYLSVLNFSRHTFKDGFERTEGCIRIQ